MKPVKFNCVMPTLLHQILLHKNKLRLASFFGTAEISKKDGLCQT